MASKAAGEEKIAFLKPPLLLDIYFRSIHGFLWSIVQQRENCASDPWRRTCFAVADVMLWRRRNVTVGILSVTLAAWVVFEKSGYTLLSLLANVLLLLFVILFLWAKAAAILNRPPPPVPNLQIPEELMNDAAVLLRSYVNSLLSVSHDIALGKDSKLFLKVAAFLWLIAVVGGWTDFLTFSYTTLVIVLTVPALYEKYEYQIDRHTMMAYMKLKALYSRLDAEYLSKIRKWILEKRKLS